MKQVCIYLPEDLVSMTRGMNRSELVTNLLTNYLEIGDGVAIEGQIEKIKQERASLEEKLLALIVMKGKVETSILDEIESHYNRRLSTGISDRDSHIQWAEGWWKEASKVNLKIRSAETLVNYLERRFQDGL